MPASQLGTRLRGLRWRRACRRARGVPPPYRRYSWALLRGGDGGPHERGADVDRLLKSAVFDDVVAELVGADFHPAAVLVAAVLADLVVGGVRPSLRARLRRLGLQPLGVCQARVRGP